MEGLVRCGIKIRQQTRQEYSRIKKRTQDSPSRFVYYGVEIQVPKIKQNFVTSPSQGDYV